MINGTAFAKTKFSQVKKALKEDKYGKAIPEQFHFLNSKHAINPVSVSDFSIVGEKSIRFELRAGDCGKDRDGGWSDCKKDRERHELSGRYRVSKGERWYAWSIYLPKDFKNVQPASTMLAQFHQEKKHVIWMFKNKHGGYWIENYVPEYTVSSTQILTREQMAGKWNDILVNVNWSHKDDGFFKVWVNNKLVNDFKGKTKSKGVKTYFKFGIYRSKVSTYELMYKKKIPTQIVYYDEIRAGKKKADVVGSLK